jgi:hypothetical protein
MKSFFILSFLKKEWQSVTGDIFWGRGGQRGHWTVEDIQRPSSSTLPYALTSTNYNMYYRYNFRFLFRSRVRFNFSKRLDPDLDLSSTTVCPDPTKNVLPDSDLDITLFVLWKNHNNSTILLSKFIRNIKEYELSKIVV